MNGYDPVSGYLQLGMAEDALLELENMSAAKKKTERYNELLLASQMMGKQWSAAADTAKYLCGVNDKETSYFIHAAFCLHETGDTLLALRTLMQGPKALLKESLYHYNLACYHAILGHQEPALHALNKAFELDSELIEVAKKDKDLASIDF